MLLRRAAAAAAAAAAATTAASPAVRPRLLRLPLARRCRHLSSGPGARALDAAERARFERDGFLVLPDFATPDECRLLNGRAAELLDALDVASIPRSVFSTDEQTKTTDDYFLASGDQVRFFFEEGAFDGQGRLVVDKRRAINKIGHALHELDPVFGPFFDNARCRRLVHSLGYRRPLLLQSMLIFKQPTIGGRVKPHQDSTFLFTEPSTVTGLWVALEAASEENGCLWAVPGSHRQGNLGGRFVRRLDGRPGTEYDPPERALSPQGAVAVPVEAGTCVLIHGDLVHYSAANTSPRSRHAYAIHVVEGAEGVVYPASNWLQRADGSRPGMPFSAAAADDLDAEDGRTARSD